MGTRDPSGRARSFATLLGRRVAEAGACVVSGLAFGIDAAAHEGALEGGGPPPVAVLAGGLDRAYPSANAPLARRLLAVGGAWVSEQPPGIRARAHAFVARNRIVAGLSRSTLVVEAPARSGALHTAAFAMEQGRTVLAVPDHPTATYAAGTLGLVRDGATVVTCPDDVLAHLRMDATGRTAATPTHLRAVLEALSELRHASPDALAQRCDLHVTELTELELRGWVRRDDMGRYALTTDGQEALIAPATGTR